MYFSSVIVCFNVFVHSRFLYLTWSLVDPKNTLDTNEALHFYRPQNAITTSGSLNISTTLTDNKYKAFNEKTKEFFADAKHVQSAMVQGWNKFCFTGGIVEFNAKLPGDPKKGGLWPALWMLGNLARATYVGSSNYIWPYSYNICDEKNLHSQKISACSHVAHYGLKEGRGRGSPEIDILEAMMGSDEKLPSTNITRPYFSTSLQIAPGLAENRPILGKLPKEVRIFVYSWCSLVRLRPSIYERFGKFLFRKTGILVRRS